MQRKWLLGILLASLLTFGLTQTVFATPDPPRVVINPSTRQCAPVVYWQDECGSLILPPGWEFSTESTCPAGYTQVNSLPHQEWKKQPNDFCCMSRGGDYCPRPNLLKSPEILPVAGGFFILAGLGLGTYAFLTRKRI